MALFQKTVEQKYIKQLDAELINAKYREFKAYFGNPDIQENIRNSKEEQYQGEFLIDLFVNILGYVKKNTGFWLQKQSGGLCVRGDIQLREASFLYRQCH